MQYYDAIAGEMREMQYWRNGSRVAASTNPIDEAYLTQAGYTRTNQTRPAARYYLPGDYDNPVNPRTWRKMTGLPASRRDEYCPTCGLHRTTECRGHAPRHTRSAQPYTTTWRTDGKSRARYFVVSDAVGSAHTLEHEVAYRKAGWTPIGRLGALKLAQAPGRWVDGVWVRPRCTLGGPDRPIQLAEWLAVAKHRNKKWYEVKMT